MPALPAPEYFDNNGRRIAYRVLGSGPKVLVLTHGLLMNVQMFTKLAPTMADAGFRVVLVDMYGHGESEQPATMGAYSMSQFGRDVIALLDHLGIEQAIVGGTSLGANVSLEAAVHAPSRVRGLFVEMPVLEFGIAAVGAVFVPLALSYRMNRTGMRLLASALRLVPRSHWIIDMLLDGARRDPSASLAVLDGLAFGRIAPASALRKELPQPALIIGHASDPIHPFSDADTLANEMVNGRLIEARTALEWRIWPRRLDGELIAFMNDVWNTPQAIAEDVA